MRIVIKSKNLELTDALSDYVEKKVGKADRFLPNVDEAQVDLNMQDTKSAEDRHVAQITLRGSNGLILRAEERSADLHSSIDAAVNKISRQAKRYKGKHWRSHNRRRPEPMTTMAEPLDESELEDMDDVVRIKRFRTRPMTVDEAIDQMELLGHDFFIFYNVDTSGFSVVYRRRDQGYGLLLPELD
jgi:putative sigma-54 modulation protein